MVLCCGRLSVFFVLIFLVTLFPVNAFNIEQPIRVLLTIDSSPITFENQEGIQLLNESGHFLIKSDSFTIRVSPKGFIVGKKTVAGNMLLINPLSNFVSTIINNKKRYRGSFLIKQDKEHFYLINIVPLEEYVAGVVGGEMPASWPLESLKAQAVVARTYAVKKMSERRSHLYDVVDTVMDQVYEGVSGEHPSILKSVVSTKGEILTYKSDIITAYYHADCGGMTEEGSNVFPGDLSYLTGIECSFHANSPYKNWSKTMTTDELKRLLELSGYDIKGDIEDVKFVINQKTGRIKLVYVRHLEGVVELPAKVFRKLIGPRDMRSTYAKLQVLQEGFISYTEQGESFPPEIKGNISMDIDLSGEAKDSYAPPKGQVYLMETFNHVTDDKHAEKYQDANNKHQNAKEIVTFIEVEETVPYEQKKQQVALLPHNSSLVFAAGQGGLSMRTASNDHPFLVLGLGGKWIRRWDFKVTWMESSWGTRKLKKKVPVVGKQDRRSSQNELLQQDKQFSQEKQLLQQNRLTQSKLPQENDLRQNNKLQQENLLLKDEQLPQNNKLQQDDRLQQEKQSSLATTETPTISPQYFRIIKKKVPVLLKISGRGWGHGVGLCQWGAKGMVKEGYNYKQILHYYYKDVEISK